MKLKLNLCKLLPIAIGGACLLFPVPGVAQSIGQLSDAPALEGVNISPTQQESLDGIRQSTRSQVESILSPEQQQQFRASLESGQDMRTAVTSLNLSSEQQQQLRTVWQSSVTQLRETITPEQRNQIRQNLLNRFGGRGGFLRR